MLVKIGLSMKFYVLFKLWITKRPLQFEQWIKNTKRKRINWNFYFSPSIPIPPHTSVPTLTPKFTMTRRNETMATHQRTNDMNQTKKEKRNRMSCIRNTLDFITQIPLSFINFTMFLTKTKPPTEVLDRKFRQHVTIGKSKPN